jgi:hypothetical protein
MHRGKMAGVFMHFSIRDVLWLTVVLALGSGWWITYGQMRQNVLERTGDSLLFQPANEKLTIQMIDQKLEIERLKEMLNRGSGSN